MGVPTVGSESGRILLSRGSRCEGASTMSGPEGLGTIDTPLPLAFGGVRWCLTQCWDQRRVPPPDPKIWRLHAL
eukprot:5800502-Pleurochrysis_carterae.AAC.2